MKRKLFISIGLVLSAAILAFAQTDKKAKEILDKVSRQYKSYKTLEVKYSLISKTKGQKPKVTRENGKLLIKGEQYMMSTKDKDIYCNGDTIWTHDKVFGECTIEDYSASKSEITPAKIFTLHEKGFNYLLNGEISINNEKHYQVDMTPTNKKKPYYKVRLAVSKKKNHISRMIMMLRSADISVSVNNQKENTSIANSSFRFDPAAKKIPVVDLTTKK
ncbi:outer membrane lipoprotein carrier protein LolA [Bacteroidia bacterium]|jgi:outer membrane lipoprotein-sorting protein|nr:outer membrane lipoprotein carrier protein LolA [Bacteroidia bacterium]